MQSKGPLREKMILLSSIGFLDRPTKDSIYILSQKGKVFLDIIKRLDYELNNSETISEELLYILNKLNCSYVPIEQINTKTYIFSDDSYIGLIYTILQAKKSWDIDFEHTVFTSYSLHKIASF